MNTRFLLLGACFAVWSLDGIADDAPDDSQKFAELSECLCGHLSLNSLDAWLVSKKAVV